jgi:hypothetical protein
MNEGAAKKNIKIAKIMGVKKVITMYRQIG